MARPDPAPSRPGSGDDEAGAGLVGTLVGFTIMLVLLLFAVQVTVHLYTTSVVTADALDAAHQVATSSAPIAVEVPLAEAAARTRLGRMGAATRFTWIEADANQVVLRVRARSPGFVPFVPALLRIDRTVTVRTERFR